MGVVMQKVYLGPSMSISGVLLSQGAIYSNGLPDNIKNIIKDNSDLNSLFVDVGNVAQARMDIEAGNNSFLGASFLRVKNNYTKGGK